MKIQKVINGEIFHFYVYYQINTMKANVRYFASDELIECEITSDFKYILLPENKFELRTWKGVVSPKKLKLDKRNQFEAIDYNKVEKDYN